MLKLSEKYKAFLRYDGAQVEILEGTTAAGKTTVGAFKFILKCAESSKKYHVMAALTTGQAERNFIQTDLGVLECFGDLVEYRGAGTNLLRLPHILLHTSSGDKIIYIVSYRDRSKWMMIRGSQFGCTYIDEVNLADLDFLGEIFMRSDYLMGTLNPDDPALPVYHKYINHCRPLPEYEKDEPEQILNELKGEEAKPGWVHWFFGFDDNAGLSDEKKKQIISREPPDSKRYKNLIMGLRGRSEGLVFPNFKPSQHIITAKEAALMHYVRFSCGVDTAYSRQSDDTIAFIFQGITTDGKLVILDEDVLNNKNLDNPTAPSDTARRLDDFLARNAADWGHCGNVFVDSADQATIMEIQKFLRANPRTWRPINSYKKMRITDRINAQLGWLHTGDYLVLEHCTNHIHELETYSWASDRSKPEDAHDHTLNASQYGFIPYVSLIGKENKKEE